MTLIAAVFSPVGIVVIRDRAPCLEETRITIGKPTWKTLDRETVEALGGQKV
jgi:hypothetical protein